MNERIKEIRTDHKLTQEEFAKRICIGKSALSRLESGVNNPGDQTIKLICSEFGVRREWLELGEKPKYIKDMSSAPETLVPDLVAVLSEYPAVMDMFQRVVGHMTPADWQCLNSLLDEVLETKKDPEA